MDNEPTRTPGTPWLLWLLGVVLIPTGLIWRSNLIEKARDKEHVNQMFDDMTGGEVTWNPDYGPANAMLWMVGIGILLLAVALTVQLVRRR